MFRALANFQFLPQADFILKLVYEGNYVSGKQAIVRPFLPFGSTTSY
jgi:hypothetical protein